METFAVYIIKVITASGLLYVFYFLGLRNNRNFRLNRLFLLFSMFASLLIPLIKIPLPAVPEYYSLSYVLEDIVVFSGAQPGSQSGYHLIYGIWIYIGVGSLITVRIFTGAITIFQLYRKGIKTRYEGLRLVICHRTINPFSIFNVVFVSSFHMEKDGFSQILAHEKAHINQMHSIDILFSEVVCIFFWINPFFWKIKDSLKSTHEYLADEKVTEQGFDLAGYFLLLLNNVVGMRVGLANNFNQSLTLKRMQMMKKKPGPRYGRWLYLGVIPLIAVIIAAVSCVHPGDKPGNKADSINKTVQKEGALKDATVYEAVDQMPVFGSDDNALAKYLSEEIKYPQEARKKGIQGKVFVSFVVTEAGKVKDVKVMQAVNSLLDAEAVRVISSMPGWTPGKLKGEKVCVKLNLPINFKLK